MNTYLIVGLVLALGVGAFFMNVSTENICKGVAAAAVLGYCVFYMGKSKPEGDLLKANLDTNIMPSQKSSKGNTPRSRSGSAS